MKSVSKFAKGVYRLCRQVPAGRVTTYGEIARALNTRAYQAVGQTLRNNPFAPQVPCHRIVKSDGTLGGFNGRTSGKEKKRKKAILTQEGVSVRQGKIIDFKRKFYPLKKSSS